MSSGSGRLPSRREFLQVLGGAGAAVLAGVHCVDAVDAPFPVVFTDVTAESGLLRAKNTSGSALNKRFLLEEMGCGVALLDYDNEQV